MESLTGINHPSNLLNLSLHYRPSFTKPISSFSLKTTSSQTTKSILRGVRASSSSSSSSVPPSPIPKIQKEKPLLETPKPVVSFLIKSICVAIFTAVLVLARFKQPSIAAPIVKPTVQSVETTENEETKKPIEEEEEGELIFFGNLDELNDEIGVLKEFILAELKAKKYKEAISILDQMIKIQPSKTYWLLWRAQLLNLNGDYDLAKLGFKQVLEKDPVSVEAYRGLMIMASKAEMHEMNKRIESAIEICKKNKEEDVIVREFKLLVAEIRIFEGKYSDALKIYQELVKEVPEYSKLYFYQWYIYTLLGEEGEADIEFEKYRKLLPKELHGDACVIKENMLVRLKAISQMVEILEENQTVGSKK